MNEIYPYNFRKYTLTRDNYVCVRVIYFLKIRLFKVGSYKEGVRYVNSLAFKD